MAMVFGLLSTGNPLEAIKIVCETSDMFARSIQDLVKWRAQKTLPMAFLVSVQLLHIMSLASQALDLEDSK